MTTQQPASPLQQQAIPLWRDERAIKWTAQIISGVIILGLILWVILNFIEGANQRGMTLNFQFLKNPAGFPISDPVLPYEPSMSFGYAFMVGFVKTVLVSVIGIFFATILGIIIGIARLSSNWLVSQLAIFYIEFNRNIPLLVLLFIFYFPIFNQLPPVKESISIGNALILNSRGIYLTWPRLTTTGIIWIVVIFLSIILAAVAYIRLQKRQIETGKSTYYGIVSIALLLVGLIFSLLILGNSPVEWDFPILEGFNYSGGLRLTPEFTALLFGLTVYTAAFIAEVVRAGIQSVSKGQREAANALGLNSFQVLNLIIFPQALRVIIPPLISQYLNLTKNSSLAFFIGYQEVFSVGKIAINQAGRAIPVFALVMLVYLALSLFTSLILNWYNRRIQLVER
jgi:general L-amino acid transport system permease protein